MEALDEWLDTILLNEQDVEAAWITLRDTVYSTAVECLGPSARRNREWFDENHADIMELIGEKRAAQQAHLHDTQCITKKDTLRSNRITVQLRLCEM